MSSTFDEFYVTETWLLDNKHLLGYLKLPGYNFVYRIREQKLVVGLGAISKKKISFTATEDLNQVDTAIEQMGQSIQEWTK